MKAAVTGRQSFTALRFCRKRIGLRALFSFNLDRRFFSGGHRRRLLPPNISGGGDDKKDKECEGAAFGHEWVIPIKWCASFQMTKSKMAQVIIFGSPVHCVNSE